MGENYADLTVDTFREMDGGTRIKRNEDKQYRFFVPATERVQTRSSLCTLSLSGSVMEVEAVAVTHINTHFGEIDLTIVRAIGMSS
jgi:hypothetical protein